MKLIVYQCRVSDRPMKRFLLMVAVACVLPFTATSASAARTIEPGSVWLTGNLGPRNVFASRVGGSGTYLNLGFEAEYSLQSDLGLTGGLTYGLGGSSLWRLHAGTRHELYNLNSPLAIYGRLDLFTGQIRGALGANLLQLGVGAGLSADYHLTRSLTARCTMLLDVGSTLGERPAAFNNFSMLVALSRKW